MPRSLRARLALWHAVAVAVILAVAVVAVDRALLRAVDRQLDAALLALAETEAGSALDSPDGVVHLHTSSGPAATSPRRLDKLVQVIDARDGRPLDRSVSLGDVALPAGPAMLAALRAGTTLVETVDLDGEPLRLVSLPIEVDGEVRYAVQVGALLRPARTAVATARLLFLLASAAVLAAVVGIGAVLTRRALAPIDALVAMARGIGERSLHARLPDPGTSDEVGRLAATLNAMLGRIERAVESQRRFTADASHELRSPLSRLRVELDVALRRARAPAEYEAVLRSCVEEVGRLGELTEALLTLARADAAEYPAPAPPLELGAAVRDTLARLGSAAGARDVALVADLAAGVTAAAAPSEVSVVTANLVENAVRFSPPGGRVTVRTRSEGGDAVLTVSDEGPGIPADEVDRVFERFFRGRATTTPDAPGAGLGLAICRALVERRGGTVAVASPPGGGATFVVRLPAARPGADVPS